MATTRLSERLTAREAERKRKHHYKSPEEREFLVAWVDEAVENGHTLAWALSNAGINSRFYY